MVVRDNTEYTREAMEWVKDFTYETGNEVEIIDPETISGEIFASAHDVVRYPAVLVVDSDSKTIAKWMGELPQFDEVTYVMRNV
jgi:hypothetical protein